MAILPLTPDYTLGKGEVFFDKFTSGTTTRTGDRYIGNTPEFNITVESETLDHFNSDAGIRTKDDSVTLEVNRSGTFITDHISPENIALFLGGDASTHTQAATPVVDETITVLQGREYQLGRTTTNIPGVRNVASVVVTDVGGATTYVLDTDYSVDLELGRIGIIEGGAIASGGAEDIEVDYTPAAETRTRIISGSSSIEGALTFISNNPKGSKKDYHFAKVLLTPNGDYALNSDEWQQISFAVEILQLDTQTQAMIAETRA